MPELVTILVMIIDCPRCGFSQPKDRYCANCGLDIDHFKPVAEPKLKALAQNTAMQVILVVIVVVALASGIYSAQQKTVKEQLAVATQDDINAAAAKTPITPSASPAPSPEPVAQTPPAAAPRAARTVRPATTAINNPDAEAEVMNENAELSAADETSAPNVGANGGAAVAPAAAPKTLNVVFLEMPRAAVDQMAAENQILNEYAGTRSIMIAGQPSPAALGGTMLPGGGSRTLVAGKKTEFNFNAGQEVYGLRIEIGHTYHTDQEFDLEVIGQVSLPSMDGGQSNTGMNGKYTIPKNASLVIVGMVPPQPIRQEYQAYFARSPLSIIASPQFQSTQSQFVMLIQPK